MKRLEHIVLNTNLDNGWIEKFEDNGLFVSVWISIDNNNISNSVVGLTKVGSNQHKVKVELDNEYVVILDKKEPPIKIHKSSLSNKLDRKGYMATLRTERDRLCSSWQIARKEKKDPALISDLWEEYTSILRRI